MTLLVFGKTGQVGQVLAARDNVKALTRADADLADPDACARAIRDMAPEAVINAAAWTNVDGAEAEEDAATMMNATAPAAMAREAARLDIPFVTFSTDYVFDGKADAPWRVDDPIAPLNAYGRGKAVGEAEIAKQGGRWAIMRTSWVISGTGRNFVTTMLRLGAERDALTVVADQIGGPTPAAAIADAALELVKGLASDPKTSGIYHFAGTPAVSWADLARAVMVAGDHTCDIKDIPSSDYPTPATRPLNSRLDCRDIETVFGIRQPDWRDALPGMVADATK